MVNDLLLVVVVLVVVVSGGGAGGVDTEKTVFLLSLSALTLPVCPPTALSTDDAFPNPLLNELDVLVTVVVVVLSGAGTASELTDRIFLALLGP